MTTNTTSARGCGRDMSSIDSGVWFCGDGGAPLCPTCQPAAPAEGEARTRSAHDIVREQQATIAQLREDLAAKKAASREYIDDTDELLEQQCHDLEAKAREVESERARAERFEKALKWVAAFFDEKRIRQPDDGEQFESMMGDVRAALTPEPEEAEHDG